MIILKLLLRVIIWSNFEPYYKSNTIQKLFFL